MTDHIQTRAKLKDMPSKAAFETLIEACMLTREEKQLMYLHYVDGLDFCDIAEKLGYSEVTMQRWHHRILRKLNKLL